VSDGLNENDLISSTGNKLPINSAPNKIFMILVNHG